jgi:hypothetical protein
MKAGEVVFSDFVYKCDVPGLECNCIQVFSFHYSDRSSLIISVLSYPEGHGIKLKPYH